MITKQKPAEVSPINRLPACLSLGVQSSSVCPALVAGDAVHRQVSVQCGRIKHICHFRHRNGGNLVEAIMDKPPSM
jgi:hypothetical protein